MNQRRSLCLACQRNNDGGRPHLLLTFALALGLCPLSARPAEADTVILYGNDFEEPALTPSANCGTTLDQRSVDELYGTEEFVFNQNETVETVLIESEAYSDPAGQNGKYAIGMLADIKDDHLAFTFNHQSMPFLNVGFDLSAIDVPQDARKCGGPFGVETPVMLVTLYDTPDGVFDWAESYTELAQAELTGTGEVDEYTFHWSKVVAALSTEGVTADHVTLVFDLIQSGYAAFDNLTITASTDEGVVDMDLDGVTDDVDPEPSNADACGDEDSDGLDDCDPPESAAAGVEGESGETGSDATDSEGQSDEMSTSGSGETSGEGGDAALDAGVAGADGGTSAAGGEGEVSDAASASQAANDGGCNCRVRAANASASAPGPVSDLALILLALCGFRLRGRAPTARSRRS